MKWRIAILIMALYAVQNYASAQAVFKTPVGKKYHLATCRTVNNVSEEITIGQAFKLGLEPCKICKPPDQGFNALNKSPHSRGEGKTVQCKGTTKSGSRCKHMTQIGNGYCFQHDPDKKRS